MRENERNVNVIKLKYDDDLWIMALLPATTSVTPVCYVFFYRSEYVQTSKKALNMHEYVNEQASIQIKWITSIFYLSLFLSHLFLSVVKSFFCPSIKKGTILVSIKYNLESLVRSDNFNFWIYGSAHTHKLRQHKV